MNTPQNLAIIFFFLLLFIVSFKNVYGSVLLSEDFEYGQTSTNCSTTKTIVGLKWSFCISTNGNISISNTQAHSGSYSGLWEYHPVGTYSDVFLEKDPLSGMGADFWMEEWIYPVKNAGSGMDSTFGIHTKWIYAYPPSSVSPYNGLWCIVWGRNQTTDSPPYASGQLGIHFWWDGSGCAEFPWNALRQNLPATQSNDVYAPYNQWTRLIYHVNTNNNVQDNREMWVDMGGGLRKFIARHVNVVSGRDGTSTNRIKIGTTGDMEAWIFRDDIKIATSCSDIDSTICPGGDTTPPAPPTNLQVQ